MSQIYNSDIRTAIAAEDDFRAVVMIHKQNGFSRPDAKARTWLDGEKKGLKIIKAWMHQTATTAAELKRGDLT